MDILTHIINTLDDRSQKSVLNSSSNIQILQRQIILSDIGFIDIVIECLEVFYRKSKSIEVASKDAKEGIKALFEKLHKFLSLTCYNNPHVKDRMSKKHIRELFRLAEQHTISELSYDDTSTLREILSNSQRGGNSVINK